MHNTTHAVEGAAPSTGGVTDSEPPQRRPATALLAEIVREGGNWRAFEPVEELVAEVAAAVAAELSLREGTFTATVALMDDATAEDLNRRYRGGDGPTNVLSFPAAASLPPIPGEARFLGDIALAAGVLLCEAEEKQCPPRHHLAHLVAHGLLHLLGHDHETEADARAMEALEVGVLARLGIRNPYAEDENLDTLEGGGPPLSA